MAIWYQCSVCPVVTTDLCEAECHRLQIHDPSATFTAFEVEPMREKCREFSELLDPADFFRAYGMGVILDDLLDQKNLEEWMQLRESMGWPNDGGRE